MGGFYMKGRTAREVTLFNPINYGGLTEQTFDGVVFLINETQILEVMEEMFSNLVKATSRLAGGANYGGAFLTRFNMTHRCQTRFGIDYSAAPGEVQELGYSQSRIAEGDFFQRKIVFIFWKDGNREGNSR